MTTDPRWKQHGACVGVPTSLFFPEQGDSTFHAKQTCAGCPVVDPCREYGMGEKYGIFGGLSEKQRRMERRRRRLPEPVDDDLDARIDVLRAVLAANRATAVAITVWGHTTEAAG